MVRTATTDNLDDIEAIRRLKYQYAQHCDAGFEAEALASLFVEDGAWRSEAFGSAHGRDEIREFFENARSMLTWSMHYMTNPIIDISDDELSAKGRWLLFEPATMVDGEGTSKAVLIFGAYEDHLVKVDGKWLFQDVHARFHHVSDLDLGWVEQPMRV